MKNWCSIIFIFFLFSCQFEVEVVPQNQALDTKKKEANSDKPFQVSLFLTSENILLWNELKMDTVALQDSLTNLINNSMESEQRQIELDSLGIINQTNYLITVDKAKTVSDELYSRIINIIDFSIELVREEKSQKIYQSSFNDLSSEKQTNMKRVVETCVIEYISNQ